MDRTFSWPALSIGKRALLIATLVCTMSCVEARAGTSGVYISRFTNAVEMLQLVETPDHHVSGQLQAVIHTGDGNIETDSYQVSGAADGSNITLTLKLNALLSDPVTETGAFDGDKLELTGKLGADQPQTLVFAKSTVTEFLSLANVVRDQARFAKVRKVTAEEKQKEEEVEQEFVSGTAKLANRMQHFVSVAEALLPKFPIVEKQYQTISSNMYTYYRKERVLAGNSNGSVARGQINVALSQASISTDQLHNQVQITQRDFENNIVPLSTQVDSAERSCSIVQTSTPRNSDQPKDERDSVCGTLKNAEPQFRQAYDAMAKNLAEAEAAYRQAHKYQQGLVTASSQID